MSTTDTRAAFESTILDLYPAATFGRFASGRYNIDWVENQWGGWQLGIAHAEAAKATGTAVYGCGLGCKCTETFQHGECNADHSELSFKVKNPVCQKCKGTGEQDSGGVYPWGEGINVPCDCEAARQPAPADDITHRKAAAFDEWIEKTDWVQEQSSAFPIKALGMHRADVMREEIERLRAALAATAAPVLSVK